MANRKRIFIILLSFFLVLFISTLLVNRVIKKKVKQELTEEFNLQFSEVNTSIWNRYVSIDSIIHESEGKISNIKISNINWLKAALNNGIKLDNASFSITDFYLPLDEGLQFIKIDSISKIGKNISLYNVLFSSPYNVDNYFSKLQTRKPYISLQFPNIDLIGVNIQDRHVVSVVAKDYSCTVSEDLNISASDKKKKLLAEILKDHKHEFRIDSIDLKNGKLEYSLKDRGRDEKGFISFNDMHVTGQRITNDSLAIAENQEMILELSAKIENKAPLKVVTKHFLGEPNYHYDLYAKLADLNLEHGNDILRSSKGIIIKKGIINSLEVNGNFNDYGSEGEVKIDYQDLKIDLNRKYDRVLNLLGNAVIKDKKIDSESFELNRNKEKSFTIHIWQSLISALRKIILVV